MLIGYIRISTYDQNIYLQKDALIDAGCTKIFVDKVSGVAKKREGMNNLLAYVRTGDTIVVWRLDRLSRSLKELIEMFAYFNEKKIGVQSIQEFINTTSSAGKLIFHIFGALAEFESHLIKERTKAGLEAARVRGKKGGRPKSLDKDRIELAKTLYNSKKTSIKEICSILNITKPTLYRYLKLN